MGHRIRSHWPPRAALISVLIALAGAPGSLARGPCLGPGGRHFALAGGALLEGLEGRPAWSSEEGEIRDFVCLEDALLVLVAQKRGSRVLRLEEVEGQLRSVDEIRLRGGEGRHLAGDGTSMAVAMEGRSRWSLVFTGPVHGRRAARVDLYEPVRDLAIAPDGQHLLVAMGPKVRTFSWPTARTGQVFVFDEEVRALATRPGDQPLVQVALATRLVEVDPRDVPDRGRLPIRAEEAVRGDVQALGWGADGKSLVILFDEGGARELPDPLETPQAGAAPEESRAPSAPVEETTVLAPSSAPSAAASPEPAPGPDPESAPALAPETTSEPGEQPTPATEPEPEQEPSPEPEPAPEPVPVPTPEPAPEPAGEPNPGQDPAPEAASVAQAKESGVDHGLIVGRVDLVELVVVKGPDNILREFARITPDPPAEGARSFSLGSPPPGRYVVIPMGRDGSSLATRPSRAELVIDDAGRGDRVLRFEVLREW